MNSFLGNIIKKYVGLKREFETERWMETENDDRDEEN